MDNFLLKILAVVVAIIVMVALFFGISIIANGASYVSSFLSSGAKEVLAVIAGIAIIIGINVVAYFQSFVWESRKKWYFWLCLAITIMFICMIISSAI